MSNTDIIAQNMRPIKQVGEHIGDVLVVSNIADEITTVSTDRNAILAVYHNLATVSTSEKYAEESKAAADKSREYARLAMAVAQGGSGTWLEGPAGIQGEKGDQGEPGQKGDQGETGSKGATGDRGPQGLQGVPGVAGSLGAQGLQGVPGVQGLQGLPGLQGNTGPAGENAAAAINPRGDFQVNATPLYAKNDYITASNGNSYVCKLGMPEANIAPTTGDSTDPHWQILALAGAQGLQGIQGKIGAKGDKGDKGETGEKGDKGETGAQGFDGAQGTAGATGAQGLQGMQGEQGLKGDKGEAGAGIPLGGAMGQVIVKKSSNDLDVMWGDVSGEGGASSGTTDHSALTNRDKIDQHPISAVTGLQASLDTLASKPSTWEELQGKPTAFTPELHATSHSAEGADPIAYTSLGGLPDLSLKQDKLPNFTDNAGKFLSTNGTSLSWETAGGGGGTGEGSPIGSIKLWPMTTPEPDNYLFCNGGTLTNTDYPELFAVMGHKYDVENTDDMKFQLPKIDNTLLTSNSFWKDVVYLDRRVYPFFINHINGDVYAKMDASSICVMRGGIGEWESLGTPFTNGYYWCTVNHINGDVWVGGSAGSVSVLRGGIGSWIPMKNANGEMLCGIVNPDSGDVFIGGYNIGVRVLREGIGDWSYLNGSSLGGGTSYQHMDIDLSNGDLWAAHTSGRVHMSRGGTGDMSIIGGATGISNVFMVSINQTTKDVWIAGTGGAIKVLRKGAATWRNSVGFNGNFDSVHANPINGDVWAGNREGEVWVMYGGRGHWELSDTFGGTIKYLGTNPTNMDVWSAGVNLGSKTMVYKTKRLVHIIKAN